MRAAAENMASMLGLSFQTFVVLVIVAALVLSYKAPDLLRAIVTGLAKLIGDALLNAFPALQQVVQGQSQASEESRNSSDSLALKDAMLEAAKGIPPEIQVQVLAAAKTVDEVKLAAKFLGSKG